MYVLNVVPHFVFLTDRPVKKSTLNDLVSFQVVLKTCKCNFNYTICSMISSLFDSVRLKLKSEDK